MTQQNQYALFSSDPAEYNKQNLKEKLIITLIQLVRSKGWTQVVASKNLKVSQPRISNLMQGRIELFSVDSLMEMLFRAGYSFDYLFDFPTEDKSMPRLELKLKKAML